WPTSRLRRWMSSGGTASATRPLIRAKAAVILSIGTSWGAEAGTTSSSQEVAPFARPAQTPFSSGFMAYLKAIPECPLSSLEPGNTGPGGGSIVADEFVAHLARDRIAARPRLVGACLVDGRSAAPAIPLTGMNFADHPPLARVQKHP